ncbi:MAG: hypothetical protein WC881_10445, partial [Elusimicrobiota bacterium]
MDKSPAHKNLRLVLLILAGIAYLEIYWRGLLIFGRVVIDGDALPYYYPNWAIGKRLLLDNCSFLWDPYRNMGQPFLADPRNQALYPLRWLSVFFDYVDYQRIYVVFHSILAAGSGFLLMRRLRPQVSAALLAGLGLAFNGYAYWRILYSADLATLAWMPAAFYCLLRQRPWALAAVLTLQWFSGFTPYCLLTAAALLAYALADDEPRASLICLVKGWGGMLGLSAIQFLPFLELLRHIDRPVLLDKALALENSLSWKDMFRQLFTPACLRPWVLDGAPALSSFYFGPVLLGLFIWGVVRGGGRERRWAALALAALALAAGRNLPGYSYIPFITVFRFPSQWLAVFCFFFVLVSACGLSRVRRPVLRLMGLVLVAADLLLYASPSYFNWADSEFFGSVPRLAAGVDLADTRQRVFHSKRLIERSASWWRRSLSDWQLFKAMLHPSFGAAL